MTIGHLRLKYFCRLELNLIISTYNIHECETQISNEDTALTFFSSKKEDILQWNETIKDAIMYNIATKESDVCMYAYYVCAGS